MAKKITILFVKKVHEIKSPKKQQGHSKKNFNLDRGCSKKGGGGMYQCHAARHHQDRAAPFSLSCSPIWKTFSWIEQKS